MSAYNGEATEHHDEYLTVRRIFERLENKDLYGIVINHESGRILRAVKRIKGKILSDSYGSIAYIKRFNHKYVPTEIEFNTAREIIKERTNKI
ncbi:MAG: hypothetical protein Q8Q42_04355 [Nanoarchaeota archaeon]|nr:hypothetical protein [Nanoarchaeota archaeon]